MPAFKVPEVPRLGNKIISSDAINNKIHVQLLNNKNKLYLEFFITHKSKLEDIFKMEINNDYYNLTESLPNLLRTIDEINQIKKPTHRGKRTKKSKNIKTNNNENEINHNLMNSEIINNNENKTLNSSSNILRINIDDLNKKNNEEITLKQQNNLINNNENLIKTKKPTHRGKRTKKSKKTKINNNINETQSSEIETNTINNLQLLKNDKITITVIDNKNNTNKLNNLINNQHVENINKVPIENNSENKPIKNKKPTHRGKRTKKNKKNCDNLKEIINHNIENKNMNESIYNINNNNNNNNNHNIKTEINDKNYIFDTNYKIYSSNNQQSFIKSQGQIIHIPPEITITPVQKKPQDIITIKNENLQNNNNEKIDIKIKKPTHRGKRTKKNKISKENININNNNNNNDNDVDSDNNKLNNRKRKSKIIINTLEKQDDEVVDKIDEYFTNLIYEPESFDKLKIENDAKKYIVVSKIAFTNVIRLFFIHAKVPTTEPNLSSVVFRFMHTIIDIHKGRFDMSDVFLTVCEEFFPMGSFNLIALVGYLCAKKWLSLKFLIKCIDYYFTYISESNALFLCVLIKTVEENYETHHLINQYWNRFKSITINESKDLKLVAAIEKFNSTKDIWSLLPK